MADTFKIAGTCAIAGCSGMHLKVSLLLIS
jgi:hypothetical protein